MNLPGIKQLSSYQTVTAKIRWNPNPFFLIIDLILLNDLAPFCHLGIIAHHHI